MSPRSPDGTIIKKTIILLIIPNPLRQKTNYSLKNFYINDYLLQSLIAYTLYLLSDLDLGKSDSPELKTLINLSNMIYVIILIYILEPSFTT